MGRFEQEHKNFEQYEDGECYRRSVPHGMPGALADVLTRSIGTQAAATSLLRDVTNDLLTMAGRSPTANWEVGALCAEVRAVCDLLCDGKFPKFMDGVLNAVERVHRQSSGVEAESLLRDVNDVCVTRNFGYTIRSVPATETLRWEAWSGAKAGIAVLTGAEESVSDVCPQAVEHIAQARTHLLTPSSPRSRKDAVRDSMSAMEAVLKALSGTGDIKDATKALKQEGVWGPDRIVKDGLSIWDELHRLYPDVRHGQPTGSDIDLEEALYWISRIASHVHYMIDKKRVLGR